MHDDAEHQIAFASGTLSSSLKNYHKIESIVIPPVHILEKVLFDHMS